MVVTAVARADTGVGNVKSKANGNTSANNAIGKRQVGMRAAV